MREREKIPVHIKMSGRVVLIFALLFAPLLLSTAAAQETPSCPELSPVYAAPVVAAGWEAKLIVTGLSRPRSILFDSEGHLLVVQGGRGIVALEFADGRGTCVTVAKTTSVVNSTELNHGIALSNDGKTLYASSSETVFTWSYDAASMSVGRYNKTVVSGMSNTDHTTRTLLMSDKQPGMLLVSRGSASNIDMESEDISTGHSQIKAFDMSNRTESSPPYDFTTTGRLLGWGLRNSVGLAEEPVTGGIYSVENSADEITRLETDIHQNNPGEEMNFHGFLNGSTAYQGGNYGYPSCFALWDPDIPQRDSLQVGQQFVLAPNATLNDSTCATTRTPPRLTFHAHMAPLDLLFDPDGSIAYISFHGSWDRADPIGYKVSSVAFANGEPVAAPDSQSALVDIFSNADAAANCPNSCFRPVGLARDTDGRLYMSSDATGELWLLRRTGDAIANGTVSSSSGPSSSSPSSSGTGNPAATETRQSRALKVTHDLGYCMVFCLLALLAILF